MSNLNWKDFPLARQQHARLQMHMLAALSEFERGRIQERVRAGLARAKARGRRITVPRTPLALRPCSASPGLSVRAAAKALEISPALVHKLRSQQEALPQDVEQLPTTP